ncbi:MAG: uroporphyrin-III C-methyltransferase [Ignavibacteria bacterium]|nr:uroporphyrin-III C-methyltransferase [Ignavibacteria bacterium]
MDKGKVYIVGAGPGDPDLITVKGLKLLQEAEVVVYDRLISPELISKINEKAELIYVGKKPDFHPIPQSEINAILIDLVKRNLKIVRLKGGDPFIFGRGAEECLALSQKNINFEVVPGVTAAIGASAYSGIPLTHRNSVVQCIFITAHESQDKNIPQVDWENVAKLKNTTIVLYMGVSRLEYTVELLLKHGRSADDRLSIIENATLPSQRVFVTTISEAVKVAKENNIIPPSLIIISPTVEFHKNLNWFSKNGYFKLLQKKIQESL